MKKYRTVACVIIMVIAAIAGFFIGATLDGGYGLLCLFCCLLIDIKENVKFPFIGKSLRTKNQNLWRKQTWKIINQ